MNSLIVTLLLGVCVSGSSLLPRDVQPQSDQKIVYLDKYVLKETLVPCAALVNNGIEESFKEEAPPLELKQEEHAAKPSSQGHNHSTMDSSDEKVQIKERQHAKRARKYWVRKKLEKEQQQAVAVSGKTSVPAAPSQQKQKQDNLMRKELNEYLINTPFASTMTEQEKIDAFYNTKLAEKRRKTKERVKRKLNKKIEMATKRANKAAEFEQAIAVVSPKRVKTEESSRCGAADAEFTKRFYDNEFKQAIAYGSKE
ncbi:hypothetical protein L0F63_003938, partial [Massospora cicadina]